MQVKTAESYGTDFYACEHEETEIRHKRISQGIRYAKQCLRCGRVASNWIKASDVPVFPPAWDDELNSRFCDAARAKSSEQWTARSEAARDVYAEYLRSEEWQEKRRKVLARDRYVCQGCLSAKATQVHHLTYKHIYDELLFELISICDACHEAAHDVHGTSSYAA